MCCIKLLRDDRGATIIVIAILLVILIGVAALAIDVGQLYLAKQRAQNVCDAAALAGAFYLEPGRPDLNGAAISVANLYVTANNEQGGWEVASDEFEVGPEPDSTLIKTITTNGTVGVEFGFARLLGFESSARTASAKAKLEGIDTLNRPILPLGIRRQQVRDVAWDIMTFQTHYWEGDIRLPPHSWTNLFPVSLKNPFDGNEFLDQVAGRSSSVPLSVRDFVMQLPENHISDIRNAVTERIGLDPLDDYLLWQDIYDFDTMRFPDSARVAIIPIVEIPLDAMWDKNLPVAICGFAGIYITNVQLARGTGSYPNAVSVVLEGRLIQGIVGIDDVRWLWRHTPERGQIRPNQIYHVRLVE